MDMINVSLKSLSDAFYRQNLSLASVSPVLRNIAYFNNHTHVELVTPLAPEIVEEELEEIAGFIESVNSEIPWHLFHLYPGHERSSDRNRNFADTITFTERIRERLPYTYFGNFPGSRWQDTLCPGCGAGVIKRVSIGACGAKYLTDALGEDGVCQHCGYPINVLFQSEGVNRL